MKLDNMAGPFLSLQTANLNVQRQLNYMPVVDAHHAYGLLREELEEFFEEAREQEPSGDSLLEELVDIAAMAQKAAEDLGFTPEGETPESAAVENHNLKTFLSELKRNLIHRSIRGAPRQKGQEGPRLFEVRPELIAQMELLIGEEE